MGYFFWFSWTSKYMVDVYRLTLRQAVWYVWIPPVFASCGGFLGGWLSLRLVERGVAAPAARFRVCLAAGMLALATAALPWAPTPAWASAGISLSIFAVAAFSVNMYTLPLDTFGAAPRGLRHRHPGVELWSDFHRPRPRDRHGRSIVTGTRR